MKVKELLSGPEKWTKNANARTVNGVPERTFEEVKALVEELNI